MTYARTTILKSHSTEPLPHTFCLQIPSAHLGSWVDGELQLGLLAVVHRQTLHQQGGEARAGAATEGVEDEEAL